MLKMYMIRHGKTYGNTLGRYIGTTDEPLLPEEAADLQKYSLGSVDRVYASPRKRCLETAEILFPGQEITVVDEFAECDFGEFENKNYQELSGNPNYQKWVDSGGTMEFPGGESRGEFRARCIAGLERVVREACENQREEVALIVHGGTIMSILETYGFPHQDYYQWHVDNAEGYRVRLFPDSFLAGGRQLVVDGKIVRGGGHD